MNNTTRILLAIALFGLFLFSIFGFFASFEPGFGLVWKAGYSLLALGSLTGVVRLLLPIRTGT